MRTDAGTGSSVCSGALIPALCAPADVQELMQSIITKTYAVRIAHLFGWCNPVPPATGRILQNEFRRALVESHNKKAGKHKKRRPRSDDPGRGLRVSNGTARPVNWPAGTG
jgi:hypothetical protein